jgi:hypothetical protein
MLKAKTLLERLEARSLRIWAQVLDLETPSNDNQNEPTSNQTRRSSRAHLQDVGRE